MRLFLVTGMHRSGTSATTRVLNLLGVSLGDEAALMPPQSDNPTGFWEPRRISQFNERLLGHLGGSWDEPPSPPAGWAWEDEFKTWRNEARELLASVRSDGAAIHAIKDPRLAITLPLWKQVTPPHRVILCLRDPVAVCQSLERRNGIPFERGAGLWMHYVNSTLNNSRRPLVVDFVRLLRSAHEVIDELSLALRLEAPSAESRRKIDEFLQSDLDHHEEHITTGPELRAAREAYEAIRAASGEQVR